MESSRSEKPNVLARQEFHLKLDEIFKEHSGDPLLSRFVADFCEHWFTSSGQPLVVKLTPAGSLAISDWGGLELGMAAGEPSTDPLQEAFQDGYPVFVDAPLKRVECNWSRIGDSLGRMEKKLEGIAA
jgi:hypothetical protein